MDRVDKMILSLIQEDATLPVADIAKRVGLSTTPCWRRIQKMEEDHVIERRVAVLNPEKINVGVTVFVSITTDKHNHEWLKRFAEVISKFPEVVGFYRMSGQVDYLLKVVVPDISAYDAFYKKLVSEIDIEDVSSAFAMERIKDTTQLPLELHSAGEACKSARLGLQSGEDRLACQFASPRRLPIQRAVRSSLAAKFAGQFKAGAVQRGRSLADLAQRPVHRLLHEVSRVVRAFPISGR